MLGSVPSVHCCPSNHLEPMMYEVASSLLVLLPPDVLLMLWKGSTVRELPKALCPTPQLSFQFFFCSQKLVDRVIPGNGGTPKGNIVWTRFHEWAVSTVASHYPCLTLESMTHNLLLKKSTDQLIRKQHDTGNEHIHKVSKGELYLKLLNGCFCTLFCLAFVIH